MGLLVEYSRDPSSLLLVELESRFEDLTQEDQLIWTIIWTKLHRAVPKLSSRSSAIKMPAQ